MMMMVTMVMVVMMKVTVGGDCDANSDSWW